MCCKFLRAQINVKHISNSWVDVHCFCLVACIQLLVDLFVIAQYNLARLQLNVFKLMVLPHTEHVSKPPCSSLFYQEYLLTCLLSSPGPRLNHTQVGHGQHVPIKMLLA